MLDTDLVTLIQRQQGDAYETLRQRLRALAPSDDASITIITFEEQMRGWLAFSASARTPIKRVNAYRRLHELLDFFKWRQILDFDEAAARQFEQLRKQKIRIGTMDLRIASIALVNGAILLTRNLRDFQKVPGLQVEDWTLPAAT